jgi:hypothetical protein
LEYIAAIHKLFIGFQKEYDFVEREALYNILAENIIQILAENVIY